MAFRPGASGLRSNAAKRLEVLYTSDRFNGPLGCPLRIEIKKQVRKKC